MRGTVIEQNFDSKRQEGCRIYTSAVSWAWVDIDIVEPLYGLLAGPLAAAAITRQNNG